MAAWFERYYQTLYCLDNLHACQILLGKLGDVQVPPGRYLDHNLLGDVFALYVVAKGQVETLEPTERE